MNAPVTRPVASAPVLLREDVGPIAILTLNRPQARNSLSEGLLTALGKSFAAIGKDRAVRAVVIAANGPAFCAGHDLKELSARRSDADGGRSYFQHIMTTCSAMMQQIVGLPQPVIAAVQGIATAAGCQLVAGCDLAVASSEAKFATPGIDIGLFCSTPMVALSRNVPRKQTMEMLLTGEPVSAEEAERLGLINRVVAPGQEREEALALARKIAVKSAHTVKIGKEAFYRQAEMSLADAYRYASEVMTQNMMARDAEEGICAFIQKTRAEMGEQVMTLALALRGPLTSRPVMLRMLAAGTAWGLVTAAGFIGMGLWNCGFVCLDEIAVTTAVCVVTGVVSIGPLGAFGRQA